MRYLGLVALAACVGPSSYEGTQVVVDPGAADFYGTPWPSDARAGPEYLDVPGVADNQVLLPIAETAMDLLGVPTSPVIYLRTSGSLGLVEPTVFSGEDGPILLLDVDPDSPARGTAVPVIAQVLPEDGYVPANLLAVAPVPGFVLRADTTYGLLIGRSLGDANGAKLGASEAALTLLRGKGEGAFAAAFEPLVTTMEALGLVADDFSGGTVFTTGDAVAELAALTDRVREVQGPSIEDLVLHEAGWDGYCELHGTLTVPEFQVGTPPFNADGLFRFDGDMPVVQRETTIPVVITVPKGAMPPEGFPLALYFHGSGGLSDQLVARGPKPGPGQGNVDGLGPAWVFAQHGIAAAGSAHPVNPERVPGASAIAYLNFFNLKAFRDTFRQGVIEQRLYLDALLDLSIAPEVVAGCEGLTSEGPVRFDGTGVIASGQSMGGMYTNLVGSVDPRIELAIPTGAGGHWSRFILLTDLLGPGVGADLIRGVIGTDRDVTFLHPALSIVQAAWEPVEPMAAMPRLGLRPLPGHPVRSVFQPIGEGDSYFPTRVFDAMTLAYGHDLAGAVVWESVVADLELAGRDVGVDYPVRNNLISEDGTPFTGVAVQYAGNGWDDPHNIALQFEAVRHQYGCFAAAYLAGEPVVLDGAGAGGPCE